ncbi:uncharacterized protein DFL_003197 [Arthrobotrys flagrans]|uniref:Uncharacterized protein n=1 Tax=Arthrobotrys flagrans TaxID=97331 RepID=A0A437A0S5_ARTFL|nr:hypothetical protein DFL_003197 [Arthrobotrys flagrans]
MSESIINSEEMETASNLPTPPCCERNTEATEGLKPEPPSQPSKKRGRPKATDKDPSLKKPKSESSSSKNRKHPDPTTATPKAKRGRQPGATVTETSFTKEQDTYIRSLYTSPQKHSLKDIHAKFEEKFNTRKSSNVIRFRWYRLKEEAIVLSVEEETALKKAIETVETNKAQAVLNEYGKNGEFTKLSQGFVIKKMKEWAADGGSVKKGSQMKEEVEEGEEEG